MKHAISVAIPTYNRADYLQETLEAILAQTYPATEIVVVDDGSTDNTPEVLARFGQRIKSLRISNSGCTVARKTAVEASTCPWLAFCDSDDVWLPHHLQRRMALLAKYPEANFSFCNAEFFGPTAIGGGCIYDYAPAGWWAGLGAANTDNCLLLGEALYLHMLRFNPAWPSTVVLSRDLYQKIGGIDPRYAFMVAEDGDMARKAVLQGCSLADFSVTVRQRRHESNTSGSELKSRLGRHRILQDHIDLGVAPSHWHDDVRQALETTLQDAFLLAYYAQDQQVMRDIVGKLRFTRLSYKNQLRFFVGMIPLSVSGLYHKLAL